MKKLFKSAKRIFANRYVKTAICLTLSVGAISTQGCTVRHVEGNPGDFYGRSNQTYEQPSVIVIDHYNRHHRDGRYRKDQDRDDRMPRDFRRGGDVEYCRDNFTGDLVPCRQEHQVIQDRTTINPVRGKIRDRVIEDEYGRKTRVREWTPAP